MWTKDILIKNLEWSSSRQGQGTGPMGSGGDGMHVRCCPVCDGIDPLDSGRTEFIKSAWGHREDCELAKHIKDQP